MLDQSTHLELALARRQLMSLVITKLTSSLLLPTLALPSASSDLKMAPHSPEAKAVKAAKRKSDAS